MPSKHILRMHLALALLAFLTGFTGSVNTASGQTWITNGPYGGAASVLAVDPTTPTTIYAGTFGAGSSRALMGEEVGRPSTTACSPAATYSTATI